MSSSSSSGGGVDFSTVLTIVFVSLKLTGNIAWPWVWVLSPLWISGLVAVVFLAIASVLAYLTSK